MHAHMPVCVCVRVCACPTCGVCVGRWWLGEEVADVGICTAQ